MTVNQQTHSFKLKNLSHLDKRGDPPAFDQLSAATPEGGEHNLLPAAGYNSSSAADSQCCVCKQHLILLSFEDSLHTFCQHYPSWIYDLFVHRALKHTLFVFAFICGNLQIKFMLSYLLYVSLNKNIRPYLWLRGCRGNIVFLTELVIFLITDYNRKIIVFSKTGLVTCKIN